MDGILSRVVFGGSGRSAESALTRTTTGSAYRIERDPLSRRIKRHAKAYAQDMRPFERCEKSRVPLALILSPDGGRPEAGWSG